MSCFGKTEAPGQSDPQAEAPEETSDLVSALKSKLTSGDGEGLFALVSNIQEKAVGFIKDNPEKAKEYLGTAQQFLKDNAAKIGEIVGAIGNTDVAERAKDLINSLCEQPVDQLLGFVGLVEDSAGEQVEEAKDAVNDKVDEVKDAIDDKVNEVKDAVDGAKNAVDEKVNQVKDVVDKANAVRDAVGTVLGQ